MARRSHQRDAGCVALPGTQHCQNRHTSSDRTSRHALHGSRPDCGRLAAARVRQCHTSIGAPPKSPCAGSRAPLALGRTGPCPRWPRMITRSRSALRFEPNDAVALLGPNLVLPTFGPPPDSGTTTLSLMPIDPSNNRGPAFALDTQGCFLPVTDRLLPRAAPPPRAAARPSPDSGCAVASGASNLCAGRGRHAVPAADRACNRPSPSAPARAASAVTCPSALTHPNEAKARSHPRHRGSQPMRRAVHSFRGPRARAQGAAHMRAVTPAGAPS
jgi:hypothetical protein